MVIYNNERTTTKKNNKSRNQYVYSWAWHSVFNVTVYYKKIESYININININIYIYTN